MGIRGLKAALRPFAVRKELAGRVVIDGPALAYYILFASRLGDRASTALQDPSYSVLGSEAIQWLDSLQSRGSKVEAVYFDGYLPATKADVRLARVAESSSGSHKYFSSTSSGLALGGERRLAFRKVSRRVPIPAFTVPAILDALRTSERYGRLTHVVPGEADFFCAYDVSCHGGTILTSDSDLILYDLGEGGSVVFLNDLEITANEAERPTAPTFSQQAICDSLQISPGQQSILSLAFEIKMDPYLPVASWVSKSKTNHTANTHAVEYAGFLSQYVRGPEINVEIPAYLKFLDPRVSEFILSRTGHAEVSSPALPKISAKTLVFYLPLLLDRWDLESAWNPGAWIRQLAYSFCRSADDTEFSVAEYRRTLSPSSKGHAIEILNDDDIAKTTAGLLNLFKTFIDTTSASCQLGWTTLCLEQEIAYASEQDKESLALKLWKKASKSDGQLDPSNWDAVHLTAQIQGTLYSLRILHQVLESQIGCLAASVTLQLQVARLTDYLSKLPSFPDFPDITGVADLFGRLQNTGMLDVLAEITGLPVPSSFEPGGHTSRRKKIRQADTPHEQRARPLPSANPFEVLSRTS